MAVVAYRRLQHRTLLQDHLHDLIPVAVFDLLIIRHDRFGCGHKFSLCASAVCREKALVSRSSDTVEGLGGGGQRGYRGGLLLRHVDIEFGDEVSHGDGLVVLPLLVGL